MQAITPRMGQRERKRVRRGTLPFHHSYEHAGGSALRTNRPKQTALDWIEELCRNFVATYPVLAESVLALKARTFAHGSHYLMLQKMLKLKL
jgi:hypothetical protein